MEKRIISLLVMVAMFLAMIPQIAVTVGAYPWADLAEPIEIGAWFELTGGSWSGSIHHRGSVQIEHPGVLTITRANTVSSDWGEIKVFDSDGELVDTPSLTTGATLIQEVNLPSNGTYYIETFNSGLLGGAREYRMRLTFENVCAWGAWNIDKAPTCTSAGLRERECKYCTETDEEVMPRLEHKLGSWVVSSRATCSTDGLRTRSCADCTFKEDDKTAKTGFGGTGTCSDCGVSGRRLGAIVNGTGDPTIGDALEILKFLAKLPNAITTNQCTRSSATITGGTDPTIGDALEILKYLAKLPSLVK